MEPGCLVGLSAINQHTQCPFGGVQSGWDEVGVGSEGQVGALSVKASACENYLRGACLPSVDVPDVGAAAVQAQRQSRDICH